MAPDGFLVLGDVSGELDDLDELALYQLGHLWLECWILKDVLPLMKLAVALISGNSALPLLKIELRRIWQVCPESDKLTRVHIEIELQREIPVQVIRIYITFAIVVNFSEYLV